MTNIVDTVVDADGALAQGQVTIHWPMFMVDGLAISQGQKTYEIVDGQLDLDLYQTVGAQPNGSYYTATFQLENGSVYDEWWVVPDATTVKLNQVRAMFPPSPGIFINSLQITGGNAQIGQFLGWNGNQWAPMSVTTINISPNTIGLTISSNNAPDISVPVPNAALGSGLTLNIPDAGLASRGVVTIAAQTFAGVKTFQDLAVFSSGILLSSFVPASPPFGTAWFDSSQNIFHLQGSLQLHGVGESLGMLQIDQAALKHIDLTPAGLSHTVGSSGAVTFPGEEAILLPKNHFAHGIGVDVNDWLWLGSGAAFAALRPDAAWVANWIDLSPYQHPVALGAALPSQASLVLYQDVSQWVGMGVDPSMQIWLRASGLSIQNLPPASPGAGSKQLWADPSDGYRVKWAA